MSKETGGPAFPISQVTKSHDTQKDILVIQQGMTLRDWFAGMALAELVKVAYYAPSVSLKDREPNEASTIARHAYLYADAMLKEREK